MKIVSVSHFLKAALSLNMGATTLTSVHHRHRPHLILSACLTTHGLGVPLCMTLCTGLDEKKALNFWDPRADTFVKSE